MKIAGIDQSLTNTAIVIIEDEKIIDLKIIHSNTNHSFEERIDNITEELIEFIEGCDKVNIEGLSYGSNSTSARPLAGLFYHILIRLKQEWYDYSEVPPKTLKKFATGTGNAKKEQMLASIPIEDKQIILNYESRKTKGLYDLSDAYWLSKYKY